MVAQRHKPGIAHRALGYRGVQVLAFVRSFIDEHGHAPSYNRIGDVLNMDKADVCKVVARLERRELLMRVGSGKVRRGREWNKPVLRLPC